MSMNENKSIKNFNIHPGLLYQGIADYLGKLKTGLHQREFNLKKAPEGKIHIMKRNNALQYYLRKSSREKTGDYIKKSELATIKMYLQKSYDEKVVKLIKDEYPKIEKCLIDSRNLSVQIQEIYSKYPSEVKMLIEPIDCNDEDFCNLWLSVPYEKKPILENMQVYETDKGDYVRSKSEINIANALFKKNIPYRYECPLQLAGGNVVYPDFTILDVKRRKVVYWEHRGMMDDRDYAKASVLRIKEYQKNGIFLGDGLIITEEASTVVLGTNEIDSIIRHYF